MEKLKEDLKGADRESKGRDKVHNDRFARLQHEV